MKLFSCILMILSIGFLGGCSKTVDDQVLRDAHAAVKKGALILDVRTPDEFKGGHLKGATNISIDILDKSYSKLPKSKTIVVYCRSGSRSAMAAKMLKAKGWNVLDVATQSEWNRKVPPVQVVSK